MASRYFFSRNRIPPVGIGARPILWGSMVMEQTPSSPKSNSGKSCILSRTYKVFAIDADPDMNLASSLGIHDKITPISQMRELIKDRTGAEPGSSFGEVFKINPKISDLPESLSINYDSEGRLKLLVMGTVDKGGEGCVCPASVLLKALMRNLILKKDEIVVLDMEAGVEHLGRRTAEAVDIMSSASSSCPERTDSLILVPLTPSIRFIKRNLSLKSNPIFLRDFERDTIT